MVKEGNFKTFRLALSTFAAFLRTLRMLNALSSMVHSQLDTFLP